MRYATSILLACGFALTPAAPAATRDIPPDEPLHSSAVIESRADPGNATPPETITPESTTENAPSLVQGDEARPKVTLKRRVREAVDHGVPAVFLDAPPEGDGFDAISVDKDTELGRTILRYCPDGSLCSLIVTMEDGTVIRVHTVRLMKDK